MGTQRWNVPLWWMWMLLSNPLKKLYQPGVQSLPYNDTHPPAGEQATNCHQEAKRDAMLRFADLIIEHGHDLGYSDTIVTGKPTLLSTNLEAHSAAEIFRCMSRQPT